MAYETIEANSRLKYRRKNMTRRPQMMKKMRNSLEGTQLVSYMLDSLQCPHRR